MQFKKSYLYYWTILPSITEELTDRRMSIIILVSLLATIQMLLQKKSSQIFERNGHITAVMSDFRIIIFYW